MLKILLSLIPNDQPAYLVLDADRKAKLGMLHMEFLPHVRYTFHHYGTGRLASGDMMVNVLEEVLEQPLDVEFTIPQDLRPAE